MTSRGRGPAETRTGAALGVLRERRDVLAVIALGGALGSGVRYGAGVLWAHDPSDVAWSTVTVNVVGGFLLGVLMVFVEDVWPPHRYVRPFMAVGVLGGFTTFSTYMLDTHALTGAGRPGLALLYLMGTLLVGLAAVWLGIVVGRAGAALSRVRATAQHRSAGSPPGDPRAHTGAGADEARKSARRSGRTR